MQWAHESFVRLLSYKPPTDTKEIDSFADSGAQTCSSGPEILQHLNCPEKYLIPTSHRIKGITQNGLRIKGVLLLHIQLGNRESRQVVYVSENSSGFYLSESALIDLGLLPSTFPSQQSSINSNMSDSSVKADCGCYRRTQVPELPTSIPFSPTSENRENLE